MTRDALLTKGLNQLRLQVSAWRPGEGGGGRGQWFVGQSALAAAHSADAATRYRGGELGWLTREQLLQRLPMNVVAAAEQLAPGVLGGPVEAPGGYYLIKVLGRREAQVRPFAEVEALLRHRLHEQRQRQAQSTIRQEMRQGIDVRTNLALLARLTLTNRPPAQPPPPMRSK